MVLLGNCKAILERSISHHAVTNPIVRVYALVRPDEVLVLEDCFMQLNLREKLYLPLSYILASVLHIDKFKIHVGKINVAVHSLLMKLFQKLSWKRISNPVLVGQNEW